MIETTHYSLPDIMILAGL